MSNRERITVKAAIAAYKKSKLIPLNGMWYDITGMCGCPTTAVYCAYHGLLPGEDHLDNELIESWADKHYGEDYMCGFICATDAPTNRELAKKTKSHEMASSTKKEVADFRLGLKDGAAVLEALKPVFDFGRKVAG